MRARSRCLANRTQVPQTRTPAHVRALRKTSNANTKIQTRTTAHVRAHPAHEAQKFRMPRRIETATQVAQTRTPAHARTHQAKRAKKYEKPTRINLQGPARFGTNRRNLARLTPSFKMSTSLGREIIWPQKWAPRAGATRGF